MSSAANCRCCASRPIPCVARCSGKVARRMHAAVAPFAAEHFITPMAAVAGAVAEEILGAMVRCGTARSRLCQQWRRHRAASCATASASRSAWSDRPDAPGLMRTTIIERRRSRRAASPPAAATAAAFRSALPTPSPCWRATASQADAAATIIANAVDLPGHPAIIRCPAHELQPDSDLGARLVTRDVGELSACEIDDGARKPARHARATCWRRGLIEGAALRLHGETDRCRAEDLDAAARRRPIERCYMPDAVAGREKGGMR